MTDKVPHNDVCPECGCEDIMLIDTDRSTYGYTEFFVCEDPSCGLNFRCNYKLTDVEKG